MRAGNGGGLRAAAVRSAFWVGAGLAFGGILWLWKGPGTAGQYFAGYLLEKALSVDNILVFVLLFSSLGVPGPLQRRVLSFGVAGALILRGAFIAAGGALISQAEWIFYGFGVLVLLAGVRMLRPGGAPDPGRNLVVRGLRRVLPITSDYVGGRFFTRPGGKIMATPLFVALLAIETTDLVFALDSIPAVFGVTRDLLVVFTSNAFAIVGLRALYFVLAGTLNRFRYVRHGLAVLLVFIGTKMLISPFVHLPLVVSLSVIGAVLAGTVAVSGWRSRAGPAPEPDPEQDADPEQEQGPQQEREQEWEQEWEQERNGPARGSAAPAAPGIPPGGHRLGAWPFSLGCSRSPALRVLITRSR